MKPVKTWVLIADAGRARVLENTGPGRGLTRLPALVFEERRPDHVPGGDDRGRAFESASPTRHAIEPPTDADRLARQAFAGRILTALGTQLATKAYDRLIVVAPARMMGDLRDALDPHVRATITGEVVADLTKTPDHEVADHLGEVLAA